MQDVAKFFMLSGLVQLILFFTVVPSFVKSHAPATIVLLQLLVALVGASVPALAAVLVVVRIVSLMRLRRQGLIVSDTHRMFTAGHLDVVLFDKTGTLTNEQVSWVFLVLLMRHYHIDQYFWNFSLLPALTCTSLLMLRLMMLKCVTHSDIQESYC